MTTRQSTVHGRAPAEESAALDAFCRRLGKPRAAVLRRLVREAVPELNRRYAAAFARRAKVKN